MGLYSDAELIYGIPINAFDDDGEPTPWWDEDQEYWIDLPDAQNLAIIPYGHYEDPDNNRAILTPSRLPRYRGDCWSPKRLDQDALILSDKALSKANDDARALGLDVSFYDEPTAWYLVASYG